jgi:hypothetical protein
VYLIARLKSLLDKQKRDVICICKQITRIKKKQQQQIVNELFQVIKQLPFGTNIHNSITKITELMDLCKTHGIEPKDSNGRTPLHIACIIRATNNTQIIEDQLKLVLINLLIRKFKCDVNNSCKTKSSYKHVQTSAFPIKMRQKGNTILHLAVHSRDIELFRYLLFNGANFNRTNSKGVSILDALIERQEFQEQSEETMTGNRNGRGSLKESKQIFKDMLILYYLYIEYNNSRIAFHGCHTFCDFIKKYILSFILDISNTLNNILK